MLPRRLADASPGLNRVFQRRSLPRIVLKDPIIMIHDRPNPDELLARVQAAEAGVRRGKLRMFLGYAAGVGKTYAMLEAARRERAEGVDVVVGYVEPHGRPETEALLQGLETLAS